MQHLIRMIFIVSLFISTFSEATIIPTNFISNQTASAGIIEANPIFSGPERVRLGSTTQGFIEGTVFLPTFGEYLLEFSVVNDEDRRRNINDFVNVFINDQLIGQFFNNPASFVVNISEIITGDEFSYRFEFTSANNNLGLHQIVNAGTATLQVDEPSILFLFGSLLIALSVRNRRVFRK